MQKAPLGDKNNATAGWDQVGCGSPQCSTTSGRGSWAGVAPRLPSVTCLSPLLELRTAQNCLYLLLRDQSDRENTAGGLAT